MSRVEVRAHATRGSAAHPKDTSGPLGSGPERVHWEEAGVRCD